MRRIPWFEILLTVAVISISLYAALSDAQNLSWRWFTRDDAYYYFKVAQNISEGRGSTFDGINPTNGYHPLWVLVCVPIFALARLDLILPLRILLLVMSGLSVGTAILLYRLIGKVFMPAIGAIAALYWVFSGDVLFRVYQQGLETGIAAFFIALLAYKLFAFDAANRNRPFSNKQLATLGILAVLTMFSRLDLVFLAGITGLWAVFRGHSLRYFLPLDIVSIFGSVLLAFVIRMPITDYYRFADAAMLMIAMSLMVGIPIAFLYGLYQHPRFGNLRTLIIRLASFSITMSALAGMLALALANVFSPEGFPRIIIPIHAGITFLFFGLTRLMVRGLRTDQASLENVASPVQDFRAHWKQWLKDGSIYFGILLGSLGGYMLWNKIAFGTFSPVSGQIKRWWGSLSGRVYGGPARNELAFFGLDYAGESNAWHPASTLLGGWAERLYKTGILDVWRYLILLSLLALIFYLILRLGRQKAKTSLAQMSIIPMLAGAWLQIFSYHITGYSAYKEWYWIGEHLLIVLVSAFVLGLAYQQIRRVRFAPFAAWILALVYGIWLANPFWQNVQRTMTYNEWSANSPNNEIAWLLEQYTEPGSIIGITGGGNAAYFVHDRTVVNMDGLINSHEYFLALQSRQAGKYLADIDMDYVLANPGILNQLPYKGQYNDYLELTNVNYGGKWLMRYRSPQP
jgi:hypothetical protein